MLSGQTRFRVYDIDIVVLNRLRSFKLRKIRATNGGFTFYAPLAYKSRLSSILKNYTFTCHDEPSLPKLAEFFNARMALVASICVCLVLFTLLNLFVFRIRVDGLDGDELRQVQTFLNQNRITSNSRKSTVRNANITTQLMTEFDFVAHATAQIRGNTFVINIHRAWMPPIPEMVDIVSLHDAVITQIIVLSGTPMVAIGDAVTIGQILVAATYQTGVEVGEMDEYGRLTYKPIMGQTYAVAIIKGLVADVEVSLIH